jgi:hypothetical protein
VLGSTDQADEKPSVVMRSLLAFIVHNDAAADILACSRVRWRAGQNKTANSYVIEIAL